MLLFSPVGYLYPLCRSILPALDFSSCFSSHIHAASPLNTCVFHLCSLLMPLFSSFACPLSNRTHARGCCSFHGSATVLQFCRNWRLAGRRWSWQQESAYLPLGCRFCYLLPVLLLNSLWRQKEVNKDKPPTLFAFPPDIPKERGKHCQLELVQPIWLWTYPCVDVKYKSPATPGQ